MAQKALTKKAGKAKGVQARKLAPNKHGKAGRTETKGRVVHEARRRQLKEAAAEDKRMTAGINATNEARFAGVVASRPGSALVLVRQPAPAQGAPQSKATAATAVEKKR